MQNPDAVDTGDMALRDLLASVAEYTRDTAKKQFVLDFLRTMKPLAEWPHPDLDALIATCNYVISVARMSRELDNLTGNAS